MNKSTARIHVIDALRGFAIASIMVLHNLEHFDFYFLPPDLPMWMQHLDKCIWDVLFFLFAGKSYAMFALLFGLTFYIQNNRQEVEGKDFKGRFAWRLVLLLGFGIVNSLFYEGDILMMYAILGFGLIPVAKMSNKMVFIIAAVLMLQPIEWLNFFDGMRHPFVAMADPASWAYFGKNKEYIPESSFTATLYGNITNGRTAVFLWNWEMGRVLQTLSLFMLGMLAGRKQLFYDSENNIAYWRRVLLFSIVAFIPLYIIKTYIGALFPEVALNRPLGVIFSSWANLAFMFFLISGIYLLFIKTNFSKVLQKFSPMGKMSLSNYVMQSIIGSTIYYGYGLSLYKVTGASYSLVIAVVMIVGQILFSRWWMSRHRYGPLEGIWHRLTWM